MSRDPTRRPTTRLSPTTTRTARQNGHAVTPTTAPHDLIDAVTTGKPTVTM